MLLSEEKVYHAVIHAELIGVMPNERNKIYNDLEIFGWDKIHTANGDITTTWTRTYKYNAFDLNQRYTFHADNIRQAFTKVVLDYSDKKLEPKTVVTISTFPPAIYPHK